MRKNIGIDFGSTYSTIASYNTARDDVEALILAEGEPASIPSIVSIRDGQVSCGRAAKDAIGTKAKVFEAFKMLLTESDAALLATRGYDAEQQKTNGNDAEQQKTNGNDAEQQKTNGNDAEQQKTNGNDADSDKNTPRSITRTYLESVLSAIADRYDSKDGFNNIVICVPEIWGKKIQQLDGRSILREILLHKLTLPVSNVRVVAEPEAASAFFAYDYEKTTQKAFNGHLLLVDYGGGTLDITLTEVKSNGSGSIEIGVRESGGAGENHLDQNGKMTIGSAGIAYMQRVIAFAMIDAGLLEKNASPDYTNRRFARAVQRLESQLKSAERMKDIRNVFDSFGSYDEIKDILDEAPMKFIRIEYSDDYDITVTYQHLYQAYAEVIEGVLNASLKDINQKVVEHIGSDPCTPAAGAKDNFKIALVGGFGAFYLVKKQLEKVYRIITDSKNDLRTKNINADKREQAIALGAALLAEGKIVLQKTAGYSIGIYTKQGTIHYGIHYHQAIEPGKPYFIYEVEGNTNIKSAFAALAGNIPYFAIEFTDRKNYGHLMMLKREMLERLEKLPKYGTWHIGFSMDESDIVSMHVVPSVVLGESDYKEVVIPLDSYSKMFELTAVKEVHSK